VLGSFWFILTLIPFLVLISGAWALAVWAARQRDSQSELVEKLTTREEGSLGRGEASLERGAPTKEKPNVLRGGEVKSGYWPSTGHARYWADRSNNRLGVA
jgi:hypothetical protein